MYKVKAITNGVCSHNQALKEAREHLGWSQSKLAKELGFSGRHQTISDAEREGGKCPLYYLLAVQGLIAIRESKPTRTNARKEG
jgi:transcriptional regulator with XRE-family HTH domain